MMEASHLALATRCACEQEIGDIGACHEQHQGHSAKQQQDLRPRVLSNARLEGNDGDTVVFVCVRIEFGLAGRNRRQVRLRLLNRNSLPEPPDSHERIIAAGARTFHSFVDRNPYIDSLGIIEPARHDSHDGVRLIVQFYGFAEGVAASGKMALPKTVTQNRDVIFAELIFTRREGATQKGFSAKDGEKIRLAAD